MLYNMHQLADAIEREAEEILDMTDIGERDKMIITETMLACARTARRLYDLNMQAK